MKYAIHCFLLLTLTAWLARAQNAAPAQLLGPDDLISLVVPNSPELTHQFRISPDGLLRLPQLATPIPARGRHPQEVQEDIRDALIAQRLLINPAVTLAVVEYASRPVTVMGAVRRPTTFQATAQTTLLDALARAEGLAPEAGDTILVARPGGPGRDAEVIRVSVRLLLEESSLARNVPLSGGEQIRVPDAPRIYVLGNVKHSCTVPVKDPAQATVLKALTQAEGLDRYTANEGVIYRRDGGARTAIVIDLKRIMKGQSPDVQLEAYDVLYIPEARGKRLTAAMLDHIAGFGSSTISGYLVYRK